MRASERAAVARKGTPCSCLLRAVPMWCCMTPMETTEALTTYADASDEAVLANYEAACAAEVAAHDAGQPVPAIVASTCDAWMREGMKRGLI